MPSKKRKAEGDGQGSVAKKRKEVSPTAAASRPKREGPAKTAVVSGQPKSGSRAKEQKQKTTGKPAKPKGTGSKAQKSRAKSTKAQTNGDATPTKQRRESAVSVEVTPALKRNAKAETANALGEEEVDDGGQSFWLMKAEPESRIEKGVDVKFSIDDLAAKNEPEAWDGVRNPTARNNMRAMMKGDLAFFYHSNCKVPGIAGIMEIVREHSTDESAFDKGHPYFDEKSEREKPKWCVVHVAFRKKLNSLVKLKELQKYSRQGGVLEGMQVLRMSRLSVSRVSREEWNFICGLADIDPITLRDQNA